MLVNLLLLLVLLFVCVLGLFKFVGLVLRVDCCGLLCKYADFGCCILTFLIVCWLLFYELILLLLVGDLTLVGLSNLSCEFVAYWFGLNLNVLFDGLCVSVVFTLFEFLELFWRLFVFWGLFGLDFWVCVSSCGVCWVWAGCGVCLVCGS